VPSPHLSAIPSSLSFGNVVVGSSSVQTDTLLATGTGKLTVTQATVTGAVSASAASFAPDSGRRSEQDLRRDLCSNNNRKHKISTATNSPATVSLSGSGVNSHSVALTWTASTSKNVSGYNIYRGTQSGGPYTKLNSSLLALTAYTDKTVQAGQIYFYVATTVDSNNKESTH